MPAFKSRFEYNKFVSFFRQLAHKSAAARVAKVKRATAIEICINININIIIITVICIFIWHSFPIISRAHKSAGELGSVLSHIEISLKGGCQTVK